LKDDAMNNKQTSATIPETVADAEQAIANLEATRVRLIERGNELSNVRASVAYKALSDGDKAARATLDRINRETVEHSSELASIDAALVTARQRLEAARAICGLA
jgi:hypothetical protein